MIFQYPAVAVLVAILTDVTQAAGVYCQYISKPYFARLWVSHMQHLASSFVRERSRPF